MNKLTLREKNVDISKRLTSRYEKIKNMKANLILVVAGIVLILLAPLWRLAIAPSIKIVPTDFNLLRQYSGTLTEYANPPGEPVIGQTPLVKQIILEYFILSRPNLSSPGTSVVSVETKILDKSNGETLYETKKDFGVKRRTGELTDYNKSDKKEEGYFIIFPFDTPSDVVPVWFDISGETADAVFVKKTQVNGLPVYEFKLDATNLPVSAPSGFPGDYTGAQLKQSFSKPELEIGDDEICKAQYRANASFTFLVEPRMGNIAKMKSGEIDLLLNTSRPQSDFKATLALSNISFSENEDSIERSVTFARDELSKRQLQFVYIPVFLLGLGVVILVIGLFAGVKMRKDGEDD